MIRKYAGKIYAGKHPNLKKYAGIPPIPAYNTPEKDTMVLALEGESNLSNEIYWNKIRFGMEFSSTDDYRGVVNKDPPP